MAVVFYRNSTKVFSELGSVGVWSWVIRATKDPCWISLTGHILEVSPRKPVRRKEDYLEVPGETALQVIRSFVGQRDLAQGWAHWGNILDSSSKALVSFESKHGVTTEWLLCNYDQVSASSIPEDVREDWLLCAALQSWANQRGNT